MIKKEGKDELKVEYFGEERIVAKIINISSQRSAFISNFSQCIIKEAVGRFHAGTLQDLIRHRRQVQTSWAMTSQKIVYTHIQLSSI